MKKRVYMKTAKEYLERPTKKVSISARLKESLFDEAKKIAAKEKTTFNSLIEASLAYYIDEINQKKSA
jgi:predicted HicB family RNase H-like nuclease